MRWGLVPSWAKDLKIGFSTINAMAETVDTKPVFRDAFKRRRCLVPVDNFYEWQKTEPKDKQPNAIALADRSIMGAGRPMGELEVARERVGAELHDHHHDPNELCAPIHNRMPVILPPSVWPTWLGEETIDSDATLKVLLAPYPADRMTCWPVSARVGSVKNNDPSLVEPVGL